MGIAKSIDVFPAQRKIISDLLKRYIPNTEVWAYGSRAKWTAKSYSDLDMVAFTTKEQDMAVSDLREAFEESDLPFRVDFFVWNEVPERFHENIKGEYFVFQEKKESSFNYIEMPLSEVIHKFIDYRGKTPLKEKFGVPLITAKIIKNGRIQKPNEFISKGSYDNWMTRGFPEIGDVVLTTEAPLGEVAQIHDNLMALAQRIITLRGKKDKLDNTYLRYVLQSKGVQSNLYSRATGTTVLGIKSSQLKKVEIPIPEVHFQKKIGWFLSVLDKKIDVNFQISQNLESLAQTIFKSWFVDFDPVHAKKKALEKGLSKDQAERAAIAVVSGVCSLSDFTENFNEMNQRLTQKLSKMSKKNQEEVAYIASLFPSEFQDSKLGEIPRGWSYSPFSAISTLNTQSIQPYKIPQNKFYHYSIPAYDTDSMPSIEFGNDIKSSKYLMQKDSVLVSKLNPRIKRVWYHQLSEEGCSICSTEFMQFSPQNKKKSSIPMGNYHK